VTFYVAIKKSIGPLDAAAVDETKRDHNDQSKSMFSNFKGLVHPKMKILSVFTYPHVVPTP